MLLDLYRVHPETKNTLIESIESFDGRLWLSYQAAKEFIRNINKVKSDSKKIFPEIKTIQEDLCDTLKTATQKIISKKVLNKEFIQEFESKALVLLEELREHLDSSETKHIEELKTDSILNWVSNSFDNAIGEPIPDEERASWNAEAQKRIEKKVPPGYMDKDKGDERQYGDIFLWKQVLLKANESKQHIILVTSEQKEDWWERHSGKTSGQRIEMLEEAHRLIGEDGKKIIVLQTQKFIELAALRRGDGKIDQQTAAAIDEFSNLQERTYKLVNIDDQQVEFASDIENKGLLIVTIRRSARNFTASGRLTPMMTQPPTVEASLISHPEKTPPFQMKAGTGTRYDFNIHIKSATSSPLPVGQYIFNYRASCDYHIFSVEDVFNLDDVMKISLSDIEEADPEERSEDSPSKQ